MSGLVVPRRGSQTPRILHAPPRVSSAGADVIELATIAGLDLDAWQRFVLDESLGVREDGLWSAKEVGLVVGRQNGKGPHALPTPILTTDGWTDFENIQSGQMVYGSDGCPVKVRARSEVYREEICYEVAFTDGSHYVVGEGHLWHVKDKSSGRWIDVSTAHLAPRFGIRRPGNGRMEYRYRVRCDAVVDSPEANLPIDPYLFGYWLGDGSSNKASITVGHEDSEWLSARLLKSGATIANPTLKDHGKAWDISFHLGQKGSYSGFLARARSLGVLGNKHIPDVYLSASIAQRKALLAGLMDSDGSIATTNKSPQAEFTTSYPALADGFLSLARSLGIRVCRKDGPSSLNGVRKRDRSRFLWTPSFDPFQMPRKSAKFTAPDSKRHELMSIVDIRKVPTVPVRCIEVDAEDGVYLVGRNFTPTHNCLLEARELASLFLFDEELCIHSAHLFDTSIEAFNRILGLIESTPDLDRMVRRVSRSHGEEGIEVFRDGATRRLRFKTRTKGGGRGFSCDCLMLDEAMILSDQTVGAILPTLSAMPNPQVWYTGSAGMRDSTALGRARTRGIAGTDPRLCYLEWSISPCTQFCAVDCEDHDAQSFVADPRWTEEERDRRLSRLYASYAKANPGFGIRIGGVNSVTSSVDHIEMERRSMSAEEFSRERLGVGDWPVEGESWRVIGESYWKSCIDMTSSPDGDLVFAVDMAPDRTMACICVAGVNSDGVTHVEITQGDQLDYRTGDRWVVPRIKQLVETWKPKAIVINKASQAGTFITALEGAGIEVISPTARQYAQACGEFGSSVVPTRGNAPTLVHMDQVPLSSAVAGAEKRELADLWAWDKRLAAVDITALTTATLAVWGLRHREVEEVAAAPWVVVR